MQPLIGYRQLAQKLNVPLGTLYAWVHRGHIPHKRITPRMVRFDLDEIDEWLATCSVPVSRLEEKEAE